VLIAKDERENLTLKKHVHIVASPFKTGTTSVGSALVSLGVGQKEMPYNQTLLKSHKPALRSANRLVKPKVEFTDFKAEHEVAILASLQAFTEALAPFDVFHDAPFGHNHIHPFVKKLLAPRSTFIWVEREEEDWLASVRNWEESHAEVYKNHAQWTSDPEAARERRLKTKARALRGFKRIQRAFPQDCLVLQWRHLNSFEALAMHYGVSAPNDPFPHQNISRQ